MKYIFLPSSSSPSFHIFFISFGKSKEQILFFSEKLDLFICMQKEQKQMKMNKIMLRKEMLRCIKFMKFENFFSLYSFNAKQFHTLQSFKTREFYKIASHQ